jgi:hypothetical protein
VVAEERGPRVCPRVGLAHGAGERVALEPERVGRHGVEVGEALRGVALGRRVERRVARRAFQHEQVVRRVVPLGHRQLGRERPEHRRLGRERRLAGLRHDGVAVGERREGHSPDHPAVEFGQVDGLRVEQVGEAGADFLGPEDAAGGRTCVGHGGGEERGGENVRWFGTDRTPRLAVLPIRMGYAWKYYALVPIGVGLSALLGGAVGVVPALSVRLTVSVAGLVAFLVMGHGMFVDGPVDSPEDLEEEVETLN